MDDREKIIEELYDVCGYLFAEYKDASKSETESAYNRFLCVNNALNLLKDSPKRKHGQWYIVKGLGLIECSVCGCKRDPMMFQSKYCNNCGAKMDGVKQ